MTPGTCWNPLADLVPEGHTSHYGIFMEDWNAYRRRQRAVATAKRQAETGFKRGPCPTHAARMKALRADPEWRARQVAAMQGLSLAHHTRAAGR